LRQAYDYWQDQPGNFPFAYVLHTTLKQIYSAIMTNKTFTPISPQKHQFPDIARKNAPQFYNKTSREHINLHQGKTIAANIPRPILTKTHITHSKQIHVQFDSIEHSRYSRTAFKQNSFT